MIRRPPRSTRTDTLFPTRRSSDLFRLVPDRVTNPPIHLVAGLEEAPDIGLKQTGRSEEHTSELQSLMRISYAVFCLKKKKKKNNILDVYKTHQTTTNT